MKISNNFETIPRRNPDRLAKLDGSVSKSEIAGGTPRKKPRNHTLCGDRERAERAKERAMMPVTQDGGDDDPAEEGGPPKAPTKCGVTLEAFVEDVLSRRGADCRGETRLQRWGEANHQAGHGHDSHTCQGPLAQQARRHSSIASAKS